MVVLSRDTGGRIDGTQTRTERHLATGTLPQLFGCLGEESKGLVGGYQSTM
jgi:hypothetical protein